MDEGAGLRGDTRQLRSRGMRQAGAARRDCRPRLGGAATAVLGRGTGKTGKPLLRPVQGVRPARWAGAYDEG